VRNVVVRKYSSVSTAAMALRCMCKNMGQVSITDTFTAPYVATILGKAAKDPNLIIFGYRWLFVQDLQERRLITPDLTIHTETISRFAVIRKVSMVSGATLMVFNSIRDAYVDWLRLPGNARSPQILNVDSFRTHYIHRNGCINNIAWKSVLPETEVKPYNNLLRFNKVPKTSTLKGNSAIPRNFMIAGGHPPASNQGRPTKISAHTSHNLIAPAPVVRPNTSPPPQGFIQPLNISRVPKP